jgi:uncharacterized membrane protein YeaQ/YmgE (transglycosylase-associated protein family)
MLSRERDSVSNQRHAHLENPHHTGLVWRRFGNGARKGTRGNSEALMYLLWQIAIGILAGWLAGKIMRGRGFGALADLLLGIVGSMVGSFVFGLLGLHAYGLVGSVVVATAGAMMLLYLVRQLK